MPPKAPITTPLTAATTSGGDTSIADMDSQIVTQGQLQEIVNHLQDNNRILKERINRIKVVKVKLPLIKQFLGEKLKLKGFLIQMHFKVIQKGAKLVTLLDQVAYAGLFLTGQALKQFKPYLTKIQANSMTTTNQDIQYIFASQNGFIKQLTQIFRDLEVITIIKQKLQNLMQ